MIWNDALYYTQQLEIYPAQTNPFQTLFEVVISLSLVQFFPKSNSYLSDISRVHSSGQILPLHILMVWLYVPIMTWADQIIWFLWCRKSPISVAAAAIYMISQLSDDKKNLKGILKHVIV